MTLEVWFWILMLLALLGGGWFYRARVADGVPLVIFWLVLLILGLAQFGGPVKG